MKISFCQMCVTFCGNVVPNERSVVGYVKRIRGNAPAKWGVQMAGMNFQTCPEPGGAAKEEVQKEVKIP